MLTPEIRQYFADAKKTGASNEVIAAALRGQGWQEQDVRELLTTSSLNTDALPVTATSNANRRGKNIAWIVGVIIVLSATGLSVSRVLFHQWPWEVFTEVQRIKVAQVKYDKYETALDTLSTTLVMPECDQYKGGDTKLNSLCYTKQAIEKDDIRYCSFAKYPPYCFAAYAAWKGNDPKFCTQAIVEGAEPYHGCLAALARNARNPSLCAEITILGFRESCEKKAMECATDASKPACVSAYSSSGFSCNDIPHADSYAVCVRDFQPFMAEHLGPDAYPVRSATFVTP